MPIALRDEIRPLSQDEFATIAYDFMACVFAVHDDLGRFFDELVYQRELANRLPGAKIEVPIDVIFQDFRKTYFLDVLVGPGAIFELKTVETLVDRHRGQLLNYLLLSGVHHGKLINLRPERVQHEFVNTHLMRADRVRFTVDSTRWRDLDPSHRELRAWLEAAVRDWGAGLDLTLYEEAIIHFFGGEARAASLVEVVNHSRRIGFQSVLSAGANAAVRVTSLPVARHADYVQHARRFLAHTSLTAIQWINITRTELTFQTIVEDE